MKKIINYVINLMNKCSSIWNKLINLFKQNNTMYNKIKQDLSKCSTEIQKLCIIASDIDTKLTEYNNTNTSQIRKIQLATDLNAQKIKLKKQISDQLLILQNIGINRIL